MPCPANLSPMFKWTGGKRRELERIWELMPKFCVEAHAWRFVEPFVGGGALFFALANPQSHINDLDEELINFFNVVALGDERFLAEVDKVSGLFGPGKNRDAQAEAYYRLRDLDRDGMLHTHPGWLRAARFFVVNQLAFSGMRRFNSNGEFNVPFGHYKNLNTSVLRSKPHRDLLSRATITCGGYQDVLVANDLPRTFIFLDPPYTRVMKTYSAGSTFGDAEQRELAKRLVSLRQASWMIVIDRSPLTEELYGDRIVATYPVNYGVNIKNRFSQAAEHIVACNYVPAPASRS